MQGFMDLGIQGFKGFRDLGILRDFKNLKKFLGILSDFKGFKGICRDFNGFQGI